MAAKGTQIMKWDEELAKQAAEAAKIEESTSTGAFFGLKSGVLTFNDSPLPNNEMAVVILDGVLENVYYPGTYDPDTPQGPACFAFGRDEKEMRPHEVSVQNGTSVNDTCDGCPMNEWGTAETGRGKACRNTRRLAMIAAGKFEANGKFKAFTDVDHFESASLAYMKLPVTSVKGYAAFVKQVTGALRRPPYAIFTRVKVVPDATSQFKVTFEALGPVPDNLMGVVMSRHDEAKASIEQPYQPFEDAAPTRGKKSTARKPAAKKPAVRQQRKY
jgi:hypothetical protein